MKQFYFHFRMTGDEIVIDEEGSRLDDYPRARLEAEHCVRELLANAIKSPNVKIPDALVIADEKGIELGSVSFGVMLLDLYKKVSSRS